MSPSKSHSGSSATSRHQPRTPQRIEEYMKMGVGHGDDHLTSSRGKVAHISRHASSISSADGARNRDDVDGKAGGDEHGPDGRKVFFVT